jgi:hypothetical protein
VRQSAMSPAAQAERSATQNDTGRPVKMSEYQE